MSKRVRTLETYTKTLSSTSYQYHLHGYDTQRGAWSRLKPPADAFIHLILQR